MHILFTYLNKPIYKHILFWVVVFSFYITLKRVHYDSTEVLMITRFVYLLFQMATAYTIIYFLIPHYKKHKNLLLTFFLAFSFYSILNILYFVWQGACYYPESNNCYWRFHENYGHLSVLQQIWNWRNDFIGLFWVFTLPTFFLIPFLWYEKNLKLSVASEQKKIAELTALKKQLNPHFLFNTLNNLYALSLEKSDTAPEVIEKLSSILDYMLYKCDDKFVPIQQEIELIENYLVLEQVRYEDRVLVSFKNSITEHCKIAPLLLLTFIENTFKHGVSQELKMATIKINLTTDNDTIVFGIFNTKPSSVVKKESEKKAIGLQNVQQQLDLLYPDAHHLKIEDTSESFSVTLKLKKR